MPAFAVALAFPEGGVEVAGGTLPQPAATTHKAAPTTADLPFGEAMNFLRDDGPRRSGVDAGPNKRSVAP